MDYKLDVTSAKKMGNEGLSRLHDFLTKYKYDPKRIAEVTFRPGEKKVSFAVIQVWADGRTAYIDGQTVIEDEVHPCTPEAMLPFLGFATVHMPTTK